MKKMITALAASVTLTGVMAGGALGAAHQVQPGDSIWSIAQNNGMTVKEVKTRNHLSSDIIYPDQEIIISAEKKEIDYTVEKGDCLSEIAEKHGVTSKQLKQWNQLKSDLIHPGNILIIKKETNAGSKKEAAQPSTKKQAAPNKSQKSADAIVGKELTVRATAYTAYCNGCSGVTATGQDLRANPEQKVIAVDPRVIPLGSKVHVEGYGTAIAGDTGGAIKGNKIDLFMPSKSDALNFGVQTIKIKVIN